MEAKKGKASSPQKYHPFLMARVGGWLMGEAEVKNEKSKSRFLGFALFSFPKENTDQIKKL